MDPATPERPAGALRALSAGLQAGMAGALWMLGWLGLSDTWRQRSFWSSENLMASVFYGGGAIRAGFGSETWTGLALYLLLYSLLGAGFAVAFRDRFQRPQTLLLSVLFAVGWYYLSFRLIWKSAGPLVALLHPERPTLLGHLVYGTFLGRYPKYLPHAAPVQPAAVHPPEPSPVAEAVPEEREG